MPYRTICLRFFDAGRDRRPGEMTPSLASRINNLVTVFNVRSKGDEAHAVLVQSDVVRFTYPAGHDRVMNSFVPEAMWAFDLLGRESSQD
jgi:hypothetical protein